MLGYHFKNFGKQTFASICENIIPSDFKVAISNDIPSFRYNVYKGEDDDYYDLYDKYIRDPDVSQIDINNKYEYTLWKNNSLNRYVRNLSFPQSFLLWFCSDIQDDLNCHFEKLGWSQAVFGYDGGSFYEVFSHKEMSIPKDFEFFPVDFPGSICGPGGLFVDEAQINWRLKK